MDSTYSSRLIDEYPILSIAAATAEGNTTMNGISELRVKESDRIKIVSEGLNKAGIKTIETADSLKVFGGQVFGGCTIDSELDHRIAMSFSILGLISQKPIKILRNWCASGEDAELLTKTPIAYKINPKVIALRSPNFSAKALKIGYKNIKYLIKNCNWNT